MTKVLLGEGDGMLRGQEEAAKAERRFDRSRCCDVTEPEQCFNRARMEQTDFTRQKVFSCLPLLLALQGRAPS
eukprot:767529-Hanusia_phi.AAC.8